MEELRKTIALLFKRKGKDELTMKELVFSASLELHWFTPLESEQLIANALRYNLLRKEGNKLKTTFDYKRTDIPFGFIPSKDVLSAEKDLFTSIVDFVSKGSGLKEEDVILKIEEKKKRLKFAEKVVIALIVGKELGVDVSKFYDEVEHFLFSR